MHSALIKTGCSAVRLAHLLWEQGVSGSNPGIPTKKENSLLFSFFCIYLWDVCPFIKNASTFDLKCLSAFLKTSKCFKYKEEIPESWNLFFYLFI